MRRRSKRKSWQLLMAIILSLPGFVSMKAQTLSPDAAVERSVAPGAVNSFDIALHKNEFLQLTVQQLQQDVIVSVIDPTGEERMSASGVDLASFKLAFIAKTDGGFRLDVRTRRPVGPNSSYRLIPDSPHTATVSDEKLAQASTALQEANRWFARATAETTSSEPLAANAIEKYQQALKMLVLLDDRGAEAGVYQHLGVSYLLKNDLGRSVDSFTNAAMLLEAAGDWKAEALARTFLTRVNRQRRYFHEAKISAEALIGRAKQKGDMDTQVATLKLLYSVLNSANDIESAIETQQQLLKLEASPNTADAAAYFENIAANYLTLHQTRTSIDYRIRAVSIYEKLGPPNKLAAALGRIASDYARIGEISKAIEFSKKAVALDADQLDVNLLVKTGKTSEAIEITRHKIAKLHEKKAPDEPVAWLNLSDLYLNASLRSSALDALEQALNAWPEGERPDARIEFLAAVAKSYENLGEYRTALGLFQEYLRLVQAKGAATFLQYPIFVTQMARSERDLGMLDQALDHLKSALDLRKEARTRIASPELGAAFFSQSRVIFDVYADVLMRKHFLEPQEGHQIRAFEIGEESRSYALLASIGDTISRVREGVDPALLEQERQLLNQINEATNPQSSSKESGKAQTVSYRTGELTAELALLRDKIRKSSPAYASLTEPVTLTLPEIRSKVLEPGTSLLEFSLSDFADSYVWEVTTDSLRSAKLPPRATVEAAARRVRESLLQREQSKPETSAQKQARLDKSDKALAIASAALGKMLLGPLGGIRAGQRLLIVTDGVLDFIPFNMLPEPQSGVPLIMAHEIVRLPSASALALIRERTAARRTTPQREIVILADPVFSPDDERLPTALHSVNTVRPEDLNRFLNESGFSFPRLSFSSGEARAIANVSTKEKAVVKLGVDANRNFATSSELENFRIVHFATHGLLNTEIPSLSGIVLSLIDKQGKPQDGFLRLHDIYNLHLNADLVVLSACQTALGEQLTGEGAISLSRGFFYAGAARVVASLWTVNDSATAKLMTAFYRNMQSRKMTPAAALRGAQIEMQQAGQPPYNWAAFELQGEWK